MSERFFITMAAGAAREHYFPEDCLQELRTMGSVKLNPYDRRLTEAELIALAADSTIVLTHWGTPQLNAPFLDAASELKLIAHCAGTVAHIASEESYRRGTRCLSANAVMAKYVAEDVLGLMIARLRAYKENDLLLQRGVWSKEIPEGSLLDCSVGLIGLGTVGRSLLDLLQPFDTRVCVYDPYLCAEQLAKWPSARLCGFSEALACDVVSVHASQTPETHHLIGKAAFAAMKDGAVFINTARGSLVDTAAASAALRSGRLRAAFDVFEQEGIAQDALAGMDNVVLQPHLAALPAGASMTRAILCDIQRFLRGEPLLLEVPVSQFRRMTQE